MWVERGVRAAIDEVGREVALASAAAVGGAGRGLQAAWGKLVAELALEPAPAVRSCPHCGSEGMLAATRCGTCWKPLTPPPAAGRQAAP